MESGTGRRRLRVLYQCAGIPDTAADREKDTDKTGGKKTFWFSVLAAPLPQAETVFWRDTAFLFDPHSFVTVYLEYRDQRKFLYHG